MLAPDDLVRPHVHRSEHAELAERRGAEDAGRVALAGRRRAVVDRFRAERADPILRAHIQITACRIVRARRPVHSAADRRLQRDRLVGPERREDLAAVHELEPFGRDLDRMRHERVAARVGLRCGGRLARLLRHGLLVDADERLAGRAVEDVDPTRLARLGDSFARNAVVLQIEQHDGARAVVVPDVVMHLLEVPAVFPGLRLDRDDRCRVQVVALAHGTVVVGARVAGGKEQESELGIDGRCLPHRRAAVLPDLVVLRPGFVARLAGARDRIERPLGCAVFRAERLHAAADAVLGAREARDHEAVVIKRSGRDAEPVLPALGLHGPRDLAGALIERDELAVELADEHLAVA